jgi:hypothetical protein
MKSETVGRCQHVVLRVPQDGVSRYVLRVPFLTPMDVGYRNAIGYEI